VSRFAKARDRMVRRDLRPRGINDPAVLAAMAEVPRERFLPENYGHAAYDDRALPIAGGQTISQPYIVAAMAQVAQVHPGDRVLEVGTGSGYGAAVLAHLGADVKTVERDAELATTAAEVLAEVSPGVEVVVTDGSLGWPEGSPYDAIVVTAAAPRVPEALVDQLAEGGRLVLPVGTRHGIQHLCRVTRQPDGRLAQEDFGMVAFVPLVGDQGF
jgi:protein-L-isoaspartate(D-aspartate) O-methyltransferase